MSELARTEPDWVAEAARVLATIESEAWREAKARHRDWWSMTSSERRAVLTYEAGYDDGYEQATRDIAAAWRGESYFRLDCEVDP